jgi:hypothetical protein
VGTVIDEKHYGQVDRHQRWDRFQRAALLEQYGALQAQGLSQRQAATQLEVPRTTLQAWRAWRDRLDACPHVIEFFESGGFLHDPPHAVRRMRGDMQKTPCTGVETRSGAEYAMISTTSRW